MISGYWIQGMLFGVEWDWEEKWISVNLGIAKFIYDYSEKVVINE
jgi:hypothetical protein